MNPSHAILDENSRINKAKKIYALTERNSNSRFHRILEIGTGSGYIAAYFARLLDTQVYAVDIIDERQIEERVQFQQVSGTTLPFDANFFDLVISNHVIEHVGTSLNQEHHLSEIFRCLDSAGTLYLAVPNRWRLMEPHYRLPFLSWMPEKIASKYVRLFKRNNYYDCRPLSRQEMMNMLKKTGFICVDVTLDAIPLMGEFEGGRLFRFFTKLPRKFWALFTPIMPTLIFICRRSTP